MAGLIQSFSHRFDRRFSKAGGAGFTGLLDTFTGASAAYSLRKLSKDAPEHTVRVRRSTDGVEVKVAFDSNNTISNSSPITNVNDEPASALTLGTGWTKITGSAGTETLSPAGSLNIGGTYGTPYRVKISMGETVASGTTVAFAGYINFVSGSNWRVYPAQSDNSIATGGSPLSLTSSGSFNGSFLLNADAVSFVIENSSGSESFQLQYGVSGTKSVGDTAATTLGTFISEASSPDLHVVTWYDQSGSGNDASQPTQSEQPRIAVGGSILVDPNGRTTISFDGSNDDLDLPDVVTSLNSASSFNVSQNIGYSSGTQIGLALSKLSGGNRRWYLPTRTTNGWYFSYGANFAPSSNRLASAADTDEAQHLFSGVAGSSTAKGYLDGVEKVSVSSVDLYASQTAGGIGSHNGGSNWGGNISEIIVYASDQTASVSDINNNIKTYYDIS